MDFIVPGELAGRKLGAVLTGALGLSASAVRSLKFSGRISVNSQRARTDRILTAGDLISLCFKEKAGPVPQPGTQPLAAAFEDEHYLVVEKPAPLPSVSSCKKTGETLENLVFTHLGAPSGFVYRPVNRLDKGTSGLMVVAKSAHAQQRLQRLLHTEYFLRAYLAVVCGAPPSTQGRIDLAIGRLNGVKRCVDPMGRRAITDYRLLQRSEGMSLLQLQLQTGRTHQIRVHLSALQCPIAGDFLYGQEDARLPGRLALHACSVRFLHPFTQAWIRCESPLPREIAQIFPAPMQGLPVLNRFMVESTEKRS